MKIKTFVIVACLAALHVSAAVKYQKFEWEKTSFVPFDAATTVTLECPDPAAAKWLQAHYRQWYGDAAPKVKSGTTGLKPDAGDEAYAASTASDGVKSAANSLAGTRWASYTLRQLAIAQRGTLKSKGHLLPKLKMTDRPHLAFRAVHLCWFPETRPQQIERAIRLAALMKFNYAIIEPWGMYKSEKHPWWGWPHANMTKEEVRRLVAIGKDIGITLIPQINCYGHASSSRGCTIKHSVLDLHPEYEPLYEPAPRQAVNGSSNWDGWSWCISNPETQRVLRELIAEMHENFDNPPFFHIGCDEAFGAQSCPACVKHPKDELLPLGTAGELCIGGDGVGAGYLNLPRLTAQKFVDNPFYGLFEGHGAKMYHTGDLAKWRADGTIEHLGRIDTQVRIRGLRIELGEIESGMSEFPGVGISAAAAKKAPDGRQYLVGYYVSEEPVDEKELRRHLSRKLTQYMVPNFFVRLDRMPLTPSGKIDRKMLPDVKGAHLAEAEYVAPQTETEKKLCAIAAKILQVEKIGILDNFFEAGGDSLGAVAYAAYAHEQGIVFKLQDVFDYPSVKELAGHIENAAAREKAPDKAQFTKYETLLRGNIAGDTVEIHPRELGNVFLTGATGFLGAHVLHSLLEKTGSKVYCLIRGESAEAAKNRLVKQLHWYFGGIYDSLIGGRIIPVCGDLESLGKMEILPEQGDVIYGLPSDVGTIIHTAATVKHYGPYDYFDKINVKGTANVIGYASRTGAKLIHISTISVSGNTFADAFDITDPDKEITFDETCLYAGQPLGNVYVRSKFEAERLVLDAVLEGKISAAIVRVGNLTNRTGDFRFQPNYETNSFLGRMKAILELGMFPDYLLPLYAEFSPVDLTAEGIVLIAQNAGKEQPVFHLYSNRPLYFDRMVQILRGMDIQIDTVDAEHFREALEKTMSDPDRNYIYERLQNDLSPEGRLLYDSGIHVKNDYTVRFLEKLGFAWIDAGEDYLPGYIGYFRESGYFKI